MERMKDQHAAQKTGIERDLIHLVKLRASQFNHSAFCTTMHTDEAIKGGEHPGRLALPSGRRETDLFTLREQAALDWTDLTLVIIAIDAWNRLAVPFRKTAVVLAPKMDVAA